MKQAVNAGLILKTIHRVIQLKQKPWMNEFIEFNTIKRQEAKNKFEKDFLKLLNNATYGRTLMNVKKQQHIQLVNNENDFLRLSEKTNYISSILFSNNLVGVEMTKEKIKLNQLKYVGFSILNLSKYHLYNFHYGYIKNKYGSNAKLLFTDTDSLCYNIETDDFYKDMIQDKQHYDLSDMKIDILKDKNYYNEMREHLNENKKVVCKFKDETCGVPIEEFIGLRSKMYSIELYDGKEEKTAKGVLKHIIENNLKHDEYKKVLDIVSRMTHIMKMIRSYDHVLNTIEVNKITLSAYDDKRYILKDGITSYAYGYYNINIPGEGRGRAQPLGRRTQDAGHTPFPRYIDIIYLFSGTNLIVYKFQL